MVEHSLVVTARVLLAGVLGEAKDGEPGRVHKHLADARVAQLDLLGAGRLRGRGGAGGTGEDGDEHGARGGGGEDAAAGKTDALHGFLQDVVFWLLRM